MLFTMATLGAVALLVATWGRVYPWSGSTEASFEVGAGSLVAASDLACTPTGFLSRQLQWGPSPGVDGYRLYHDGPLGGDEFDLEGEVAAPAATYEGLVVSLLHHRWYVTSYLGSWESAPSDTIEVHCRPRISLPGPCCLKGENHHSERTVELTWGGAPGAASYAVLRGTQSDGPYELLTTIGALTYADTAASDGVTYYYVVVALDADGNESDPSLQVAVADVALSPMPSETYEVEATPTTSDAATPEPTATDTSQPTWMIEPGREPASADGSQPTWMIEPGREPAGTSTPTWMVGPGREPASAEVSQPTWMVVPGSGAEQPATEPATRTPEATATPMDPTTASDSGG